MANSKWTLLATVDGQPCQIDHLETLAQDMAYPGGHRYRLQIQGTRVERAFGDLIPRQTEPIDIKPEIRAELLMVIGGIFRSIAQLDTVDYFINTVDIATYLGPEVIEIQGDCSAKRNKAS